MGVFTTVIIEEGAGAEGTVQVKTGYDSFQRISLGKQIIQVDDINRLVPAVGHKGNIVGAVLICGGVFAEFIPLEDDESTYMEMCIKIEKMAEARGIDW